MLRRSRREKDLDKELRSHVEQQIADYVSAGLPVAEARRRARLEFGGLLQVREAVRDTRRWAFLEILARDVRHAVRSLIAAPAFTIAAVLSLGLGVGANTAIFTIVDALMLRPLAVNDPASLTVLAFPRDATHFDPNFSDDELREVQRGAASAFSGINAVEIAGLFGPGGRSDGLTVDSITRPVQALFVSGAFFQMLGVQPHLGRLILPSEGAATGADPVAVLSYNYWQARFHGDPAILNKPALINGRAVTIVGIAPKGFLGPTPIIEMEAYLPLGMRTVESGDGTSLVDEPRRRELLVIARLAPRMTLDRANAVLAALAPQLMKDFPREGVSGSLRARPLRPPGLINGPNPLPTLAAVFFVLSGLVFALACLNVTNLTLVRAAARRRELAVRAALGGSRARLLRHLVTETLVVAFLGGIVGTLAGGVALRALASKVTAAALHISVDFSFDRRVFLFASATAAVATIFVGVLPALRASGGNLIDALRDGGRGATGKSQRVRTALVAAQVGGTMALLIAAGLFVRSLGLVQQADLGFDGQHVLNVRLDPGEVGYSKQRGTAFYRELLSRVRTLPGVESASVAATVPLADDPRQAPVEVSGYVPRKGEAVQADVDAVSPAFFETLRIPLVAGRGFTEADEDGRARVAVINEAMASRFWRAKNPLGRTFVASGDRSHPLQIVGVVRNSRIDDPYSPIGPAFFVPFAQAYAPDETLQIRTTGPPELLAQDVLAIVRTIAPAVPVLDAKTMTDAVANGDSGFFIFTIGAMLTGALGLLGLALAIVGIYGVMAYAVGQRTHEIGIRLALGASRPAILWFVSRQGLAMVSIGLMFGAAAAAATGELIRGFLVGVGPMDPPTYAAVAVLLAVAALAACYVPLRRATRVDPLIALRQE